MKTLFFLFLLMGVSPLFGVANLIELQGGFNYLGQSEADAATSGGYARVTNAFDSAWKLRDGLLFAQGKFSLGLEVMFLNREVRYAKPNGTSTGTDVSNYFIRHTPLYVSLNWYLAGYQAPLTLVLSVAGGFNAEHQDVKVTQTLSNGTVIQNGIRSAFFTRFDPSFRPGIELNYRIHEHSRFILTLQEFFNFENALKIYPAVLLGLEYSFELSNHPDAVKPEK